MSATVRGLAFTPVKGLRLRAVDELEFGPAGATGNRRFYVIDARDRMVNGKTIGELSTVVADLDGNRLTLTFPDGREVSGEVREGATIRTRFFSRVREDHLVPGPWAEALSERAGQPLRLVQANSGGTAVDRGRQGAISLISHGSLRRLAAQGDIPGIDVRRFRMTVEIDGVQAHEEDGWVGRRIQIGSALVRFHGHVGRCLVTSRDPDTGVIDLPTLDLLGQYRGDTESTEPLPFGIYGEVLEPGSARLGDAVAPAD